MANFVVCIILTNNFYTYRPCYYLHARMKDDAIPLTQADMICRTLCNKRLKYSSSSSACISFTNCTSAQDHPPNQPNSHALCSIFALPRIGLNQLCPRYKPSPPSRPAPLAMSDSFSELTSSLVEVLSLNQPICLYQS